MKTAWIKKYQPQLYRTITSSFQKERLFHAYLITGKKDLLEVASWLAAFLIEQTLDEENLDNRVSIIEEKMTFDVVTLDGSTESIKKETVLDLLTQFSQTAMEISGKKVAIIHHCENASIEALNSLLKSVEDPSGTTTYYILTTDNLNQVLETIISRCVVYSLEQLHEEEIIARFEALGLDRLSAYLLSTMTSQEKQVQQTLESYSIEEDAQIVYDFFNTIIKDLDLAIVNLQLEMPTERFRAENVFKMMSFVVKDQTLPSIKHLEPYTLNQIHETILKSLAKMNRSVSVELLVDQFAYILKEVDL